MSKPKVLSLFTGAGGLDYGFEAAGFDTAVAIEMDHDSCETLRKNRKKWKVIEDDIFNVDVSAVLDTVGLERGSLDMLIGGPPCQPFSKAGYWVRGDSLRLDDPRSNTLQRYLEVVKKTLPRALLLENVRGLIYAGKDEGLRAVLTGLEEINKSEGTKYKPSLGLLNAADYGVPQLRERAFIIAGRDGQEFAFPKPTHYPKSGSPNRSLELGDSAAKQTHTTAWDAISEITPPPDEDLEVRGKWAELLPSIPEGKNYLVHTKEAGGIPLFGWRRRYWTFLLKLAKDQPSWTIQAQPGPAIGPFHWDNRRLSVIELCRLQTFPSGISPVGGRTSVQRQLGNAVPSLLAEVLAREIREQLLGLPALKSPLKLLPRKQLEVPPPTPPMAIPAQFLALQGDHPAHPGTGKGHRASMGPISASK